MSREAAYVSDPTMPIWLIVALILGLVCIAVRGGRNSAQHGHRGRWGMGSRLLMGLIALYLIKGFFRKETPTHRVDVSWNVPATSPNLVISDDHEPTPDVARGTSRRSIDSSSPRHFPPTPNQTAAAPPQPVPAPGTHFGSNALATGNVVATTFTDHGVRVRVSDQPPAWLETSPGNSVQNSEQATLPVSSQWFATEDEAIEQTKTRAWDFVRQTFRDRLNVALPETPPLDLLIDKGIVVDFQLERVLKDFGNNLKEPMFRAHARLNFNTTQASPLYQQWLAHVRSANSWRLGIAVISATFCLGFFGQCLRWNHATGGRYRRRLIAASTAIAMSAAAVAVWLPTWIRA